MKGKANVITTSVKESIMNVYHQLGGDAGFAVWAKEHPSEYYNGPFKALIPRDITSGGEKINMIDPQALSTEELTKIIGAINQKR